MSFLSETTAARVAGTVTPARKYLILACDGGGIRGLITARIIQRLQEEVPFLDQVELYAGTSTGGIIALGLADGISPGDLVALYRNRGPEIFDRSGLTPAPSGQPLDWLDRLVDRVEVKWQTLDSFQHDLRRPKYPNEGLARILTDLFGDRTMGSLRTGKGALVTTLRLCSSDSDQMWAPLVLHTLGDDEAAANTRVQDRPTRATKLVDACLATSAAPLYFPPHEHPEFGYCVDGGLYANCPSSIALALAIRANQGESSNIRILSIGTGVQISGIDIRDSAPFNQPSDYGSLAWLDPFPRGRQVGGAPLTPAFPLISALFDASSASHNYICQQALGAMYQRVQVTLPRPIDLDDTSATALSALEAAAHSIPLDDWQITKDWLRSQLT